MPSNPEPPRARTREPLDAEERNGRLVAPPSALAGVPAHLRVEQAFGWGWPTFGGTCVIGGLFALGRLATGTKAVEGGVYGAMAAAVAVGAIALLVHVRAVRRRVVLAPTEKGVAIYRNGRLFGETTRNQLTPYAHRVFNTLYLVVILGLSAYMAVTLGAKDPGVILVLLPIVAMVASNIRSRFAFTHLYVIRGESTAMFPSAAFAKAFGDVQRWA